MSDIINKEESAPYGICTKFNGKVDLRFTELHQNDDSTSVTVLNHEGQMEEVEIEVATNEIKDRKESGLTKIMAGMYLTGADLAVIAVHILSHLCDG